MLKRDGEKDKTLLRLYGMSLSRFRDIFSREKN